MRSFDFSPLLRSSIGFENLNRLVDFAARGEGESYPPYNIEKVGHDAYRISMAVAGFKESELDLTVQENVLIVVGKAGEPGEDTREFIHRGIAKRAFERRFQLADTIKVVGASYEAGLLNIDLKREVPEHKKPRKIEIGATEDRGNVIEAPVSQDRIAA
ncbi:MAG: Hsp20 family protein [Sphingomonadaceae bacterium]|nr:Hsp20 family protein [Sphingomonadaceae bacterium]